MAPPTPAIPPILRRCAVCDRCWWPYYEDPATGRGYHACPHGGPFAGYRWVTTQ